ncbi:MAG TPA: hypothetical protein VFT80_06780 [Actinomycetota bacterium]|nr:hypothetical protein [Actinomycetota bacterium]
MGEFSRGGSGPLFSEGRRWEEEAREEHMLEEAERVHEAHLAEPRKRRWRLWPFGRRRGRSA